MGRKISTKKYRLKFLKFEKKKVLRHSAILEVGVQSFAMKCVKCD